MTTEDGNPQRQPLDSPITALYIIINLTNVTMITLEEHYVGRRAMEMKVQGRRKRGRPMRRWLDKVRDNIKRKELSADDVYDRATWRRMSLYIDPT